MRSRRIGRILVKTALGFGFVLLLAGCTPSAVFVADPLLTALTPDREEFEDDLRIAATGPYGDIHVHWLENQILDQVNLANVVDRVGGDVIVLSPFLSLYASDVADSYPETHFVTIGAPNAQADNIVSVRFNSDPAWREAGRVAAAWLAVDDDRRLTVLVDTSSAYSAGASEAFLSGLGSDTREITVERFLSTPARDRILALTRAEGVDAGHLVVLLLGSANAVALEALRATGAAIAGPNIGIDVHQEHIVMSVNDSIPAAIAALTDTKSSGSITALSELQIDTQFFGESAESR